jgi:hypothetical protein
MAENQQTQQTQQAQQTQDSGTQAAPQQSQQQAGQQPKQQQQQHAVPEDFDALKDKKPEELTPEELRLMADTMPGEGPGD